MKYFNNCKNLEELRKEYKKLVKKFHPDNCGGSDVEMKIITTEYSKKMELLKNCDTEENVWKYDYEKDNLFRDALNKIIALENIEIEIIGCWIWVTGDTYSVKDILKNSGFKFCSKKKAWSWHAGEKYYKKSKRSLTMNELRDLYGCEKVESKKRERIA